MKTFTLAAASALALALAAFAALLINRRLPG